VALIIHGISRQVNEISNVFTQAAIGNYAARAKVISNDELGTIAASLNSMLEHVLSSSDSRQGELVEV
jgi:methyl-accepting chemotaxis protein